MTLSPLDLGLIARGEPFEILLTLSDESEAVSIVDWEVCGETLTRPAAVDPIALPFTISDAGAGEITLALSEEETLAMPEGRFAWQMSFEYTGKGEAPMEIDPFEGTFFLWTPAPEAKNAREIVAQIDEELGGDAWRT